MKTKLSRKAKQMGTTLMVVLILCTVFSAAILGYLSVIEHQNYLCARSQTWDAAMVVVEAGIEEGLQHLNNSTNNLAADGWTQNGTTYTITDRTLANGNKYTVTINNADPANPSVVSRATVVPPRLFSLNRQPALLAAAGVPVNAQEDFVRRAVRVTTTKSGLFTAALVAKHSIDLKGNGVYTDSFDSSQPGFKSDTNGFWNPSIYSGDMGDIAANGGLVNDSVSIQNANIYGYVHTGPGMPVSVGSQGAVGTHAWQASHKGFQDGYVLQDANFTFPDTSLPSTSDAIAPAGGDIMIPTYTVGSASTTSTTYPSPVPAGGVSTNFGSVTTGTYPSPVPAGGVITNSVNIITLLIPSPIPPGLTTNNTTTTSGSAPVPGSYVGNVTTNYNGSGKKITGYTYKLITGYTYSTKSYTYSTLTYVYTAWSTNITYVTNHYDNILETGKKYVSSDLNGSTYIAGPDVTLVLPNGLDGGENLKFKLGANLTVYSGGTSISISGNQVINPNGYAGSLIVLAAPSVTSFTLNGNGEFTGVLVAPNADLKLNGGGSGDDDFTGSLMVNNVRLNGHFSFHYDEALRNASNKGRYLITSWDEINPN